MAARTLRITEPKLARDRLARVVDGLERDGQHISGLVIPRSFNLQMGVKHDKIEINGNTYRTRPQKDSASNEIVIEHDESRR